MVIEMYRRMVTKTFGKDNSVSPRTMTNLFVYRRAVKRIAGTILRTGFIQISELD